MSIVIEMDGFPWMASLIEMPTSKPQVTPWMASLAQEESTLLDALGALRAQKAHSAVVVRPCDGSPIVRGSRKGQNR